MTDGVTYGYTRVSTNKQDDLGQRDLLLSSGVSERNLFCDTFTGANINRPNFERLDKILRPGDTVVCTAIWRIGRSDKACQWLIDLYRERGVNFVVLDCEWLGPGKSQMADEVRNGILWFFAYMGRQYLETLSFATRNGMRALALTQGMKPGRAPIQPETAELIRKFKAEGWSRNKIARTLGVGTTTVFKYTSDPDYNPAPPRRADSTIARELANGKSPAEDTVRVHRDRRLSKAKRNGHSNGVAVLESPDTFSVQVGRPWDDEPLPF